MPLTYPKLLEDILPDQSLAGENISHIERQAKDFSSNPEGLRLGVMNTLMPGLSQMIIGEDNKAFLYLTVSFISANLLIFLLVVGNLSELQIEAFSNFLANIPFADFNLSKKLISQLKFPNPFTVSVLITNVVYTALAISDAIQSYEKKERAKKGYKVAAHDDTKWSESGVVSFGLHILIILLLLLTLFLNFNPRPKVNITEIEYIPTQVPSKKAPSPNTKRRAAQQSIDQGKNNPKQKTTPVTQPPGRPKVAPTPKAAPKPSPRPKQVTPQPKTEPTKPIFKPLPTSKPSPKPIAANRDAINEADTRPKPSLPKPLNYNSSSSNTSTQSNSSPAPKASNSGSDTRSSNLVTRLSNLPRIPNPGSAGNGGALGANSNPGANPFSDAPPSVAARADVNFGPYMSSLQRKIKLAWKPPRGTESNRIVVVFTVNRSGQMQNAQLSQSSSSQAANAAALDAVRRAAPFNPLPPGSPPEIEIEFTFDYNVFQKRRF